MKVKNLIQTCGACPSQWEFDTDGNRRAYVRYRGGYLSVRISLPGGDTMGAVTGYEVLGQNIGGSLDGVLEWEEVAKRIKHIQIEPHM
jgi:hypothetical protein